MSLTSSTRGWELRPEPSVHSMEESMFQRDTLRPGGLMNRQMILLRVEQGVWEGWQWMALDDFLKRVRLDNWNAGEESMVGMILPAARQGMLN